MFFYSESSIAGSAKTAVKQSRLWREPAVLFLCLKSTRSSNVWRVIHRTGHTGTERINGLVLMGHKTCTSPAPNSNRSSSWKLCRIYQHLRTGLSRSQLRLTPFQPEPVSNNHPVGRSSPSKHSRTWRSLTAAPEPHDPHKGRGARTPR